MKTYKTFIYIHIHIYSEITFDFLVCMCIDCFKDMKRRNVNRTNNFPRISVSSLKMSFPLLSQLLLKFFIYDKYLPEKKNTRRNVLNKKTGSKEILI